MKKYFMMGLAALLATPVAFAAGQMPMGMIAGHVTMLDADFDDGTGFGIRGWGKVADNAFVHGEYSMVGLETPGGIDVDVNELRFGGGIIGALQQNAMWFGKLEYIDLGSDFADGDGFGVHGGAMFPMAPALGLFGSVGFIKFDDDDGLEFNIGGHYAFTKEVSGILDYRAYSGDADLTELRFAVGYMFY